MTDRDRRIMGIERKLQRGRELRQALQELVNKHVEAYPITLRADPVGQAPIDEYQVVVEDYTPPDYVDIGVRIGEILNIYRSAIENLVWHLAIQHTGSDPPPGGKSLGFPVVDEKTSWKNAAARVKDLPVGAIEVMRKAQPFRQRNAPAPEPLTLLRELNNSDKHRVIVPMAVMPRSFEQVGQVWTDVPAQLDAEPTGEAVINGAVVYRLRFSTSVAVSSLEFHGSLRLPWT